MEKSEKNFLALGNETLRRSSDFGKKLEKYLTLGNETLRRSSVFGKRWWVHDSTRREGKVKEFIFSTSENLLPPPPPPPREGKVKKEFRFRKKLEKYF